MTEEPDSDKTLESPSTKPTPPKSSKAKKKQPWYLAIPLAFWNTATNKAYPVWIRCLISVIFAGAALWVIMLFVSITQIVIDLFEDDSSYTPSSYTYRAKSNTSKDDSDSTLYSNTSTGKRYNGLSKSELDRLVQEKSKQIIPMPDTYQSRSIYVVPGSGYKQDIIVQHSFYCRDAQGEPKIVKVEFWINPEGKLWMNKDSMRVENR